MFTTLISFITLSNAHFFGDAPIFTPKNLHELDQLEKGPAATILMMYAPWCGHCKHLAPEYAKAAKAVNGKAIFAAVDCTENESICAKYQVQGYPTVKVFEAQKGRNARKASDYNGPREAKAIENFMYSKIPNWVEKLPEELPEGSNSVILFSEKAKRTLMYKAIAMHAAGSFNFYDCSKEREELVKKYNVESYPTLFVKLNGGELKKYEGKMEFYAIMDYLQSFVEGGNFKANPSQEKEKEDDGIPYVNVHALNDEMFKKQCNNKACLVMIFGEEDDKEVTSVVAEGMKGKMHTVSFTCAEQNGVCNKLNLFYDTPTALIYIPNRKRIIRFVGGFNAGEVVSFAKEALLGRAGRMENLPEFPSFIDRVAEPYVPPVYEEEL